MIFIVYSCDVEGLLIILVRVPDGSSLGFLILGGEGTISLISSRLVNVPLVASLAAAVADFAA